MVVAVELLGLAGRDAGRGRYAIRRRSIRPDRDRPCLDRSRLPRHGPWRSRCVAWEASSFEAIAAAERHPRGPYGFLRGRERCRAPERNAPQAPRASVVVSFVSYPQHHRWEVSPTDGTRRAPPQSVRARSERGPPLGDAEYSTHSGVDGEDEFPAPKGQSTVTSPDRHTPVTLPPSEMCRSADLLKCSLSAREMLIRCVCLSRKVVSS